MRRASPEAIGYAPGASHGTLGAASRHGVVDRAELELLRLPQLDERQLGVLGALAKSGLGGVVDAGRDEAGPWLVRRLADATLAELLRASHEPWPWVEAGGLVRDLSEALALAAELGLALGALRLDGVGLDRHRRGFLLSSQLVAELTGEAEPTRGTEPPPLYTPLAQLEGRPWDERASVWWLALVFYRLVAGRHPLQGLGLRRALEEMARSAFPPFDEAIAAELPPGLQSLVLRALGADEATRQPPTLRELADAFASAAPKRGAPAAAGQLVARTARASRTDPTPAPGEAHPTPVDRTTTPERPPSTRSLRSRLPFALPLLGGAAIAAAALSSIGPAPAPPPPRAPLPAANALSSSDTDAASCASCHPRQANEWKRSVMGHSVKSPLFNALESLIEEQVGRDRDCPEGAGILRRTNGAVACRDAKSGLPVSGSGGEHWCVNCHAPLENLSRAMPAWEGRAGGSARSRLPVRDLLSDAEMEGISCAFCHQVHGPVGPKSARGYQGNPSWTSFVTGAVFSSRPEDRRGELGISNSGYDLDPSSFLVPRTQLADSPAGVHLAPRDAQRDYLRSSRFCGACHDVRLFGSDVVGATQGEHFKRLRNAYSEWEDWAEGERRRGRTPASCQDCHMSAFPGVCVEREGAPGDRGCPPGTAFEPRAPGERPEGLAAVASRTSRPVSTHYFSGVDLPLSHAYPEGLIDEAALDAARIPLSSRARRDMLLAHSFRFELGRASLGAGRLELPVVVENVGAGHRIPAGFSQEREFWVHLRVTDARGRTVYEVGRVERADEDLRDKIFERVNTDPNRLDAGGRPIGLFGADVRDGPDVPRWSPPPDEGGTLFRGRGLVNFQNGFQRCVTCIGVLTADGRCEPGPGQGRTRADRFDDGNYDLDTGACRSNLSGRAALFETYFPVGALDASRGLPKAPDAIIDTRSLPPRVPTTYVYELDLRGAALPLRAEARLLFRAFPPFLIRAFADYEREMTRLGKRPSGPSVDRAMLERLEIVEIARAELEVSR